MARLANPSSYMLIKEKSGGHRSENSRMLRALRKGNQMMNHRNHLCLKTPLTLFVLMMLVALPAFTAAGRVEATEPVAAAPDKPVVLGGKVTLQPLDFERAYDRPLLTSPPFTVEQIKAIAGARLSKVGNQFFIINKKRRAVAIEQYVAQLNQYEIFLNKYGLTLRDGPLAAPAAKPGPVNSNLGTILKLKPKSKKRLSYQR